MNLVMHFRIQEFSAGIELYLMWIGSVRFNDVWIGGVGDGFKPPLCPSMRLLRRISPRNEINVLLGKY